MGFRRLPTKLGRSDGILHLFHKELIFGNRRTGPRVFEDCVSRNKAVYDADSLCDFRLEHGELKQLSRRPGLLTRSGIRHFAVYDYGSLQFWIDLLSHFDQQQHILSSPIIGAARDNRDQQQIRNQQRGPGNLTRSLTLDIASWGTIDDEIVIG